MFGDKVKELRCARNNSQVQLASALHVSKQTVSNWENNNILPSVEMLLCISRYFGVSTDYLLEQDDRIYLEVTGLTQTQQAHLRLLIEDLLAGTAP